MLFATPARAANILLKTAAMYTSRSINNVTFLSSTTEATKQKSLDEKYGPWSLKK